MYRTVFFLLISLLLMNCIEQQGGSKQSLPYYNEPDFTPLFLNDEEAVAKRVTHTIGDFSLLNQDSNWISQKMVEGKIHVANFIFTSCGSICPAMTSNLKMVSDSVKDDPGIFFLSYSVTPWKDKPHVLQQYKRNNAINSNNWHFLTGTRSAIYTLARQSYFAEEDIGYSKDSTEFLHTEHFVLVDKDKRIRGIYNGTLALEMHQLLEDIFTLKQE